MAITGEHESQNQSAVMIGVIVIMTLLVVFSGWNIDCLNQLIDLAVKALLHQMMGG
jgi:hypothetical protein